ncbi:ROK family protein [Tropicimonas sp.]|uniref:ROK family protein n=1 Tax=Tropicimonas sp. TaxID=2067044 RepID=UPI003A89F7FF
MTDGFAVDLGGTKTALARIAAGRIEARLQFPTDRLAGISEQIDILARHLGQMGFRRDDRLGVAVSGRVDAAGNWYAVNSETLPQIGGEPLLGILRTSFGRNVSLMNDAAAAALAEATLGAGAGAGHFAYLTVSTGVGGGVVLDGRLLNSRNGLAGHVGFLSSPHGDACCGSGRTGTVESIASGRAIARLAGTGDSREAFASRSVRALAAIDRSAMAIARLCADLNAIFGLDRIAVGGSVGLAAGYLPRVSAHLDREPSLFRVPLVPATLGQNSALLGAIPGG